MGRVKKQGMWVKKKKKKKCVLDFKEETEAAFLAEGGEGVGWLEGGGNC